jgi:hypothetical protein
MSRMTAVVENVEHFRRRVVQDALSEATAGYWRRRAEILEWAMPRHGDFNGEASTEELRERWCRLRDEATACRNRARVAELGGEEW